MLEQGAQYGSRAGNDPDLGIWAPYYTLHKILAGLLDAYEVAGNKKALEIAKGMGAWTHARLSALPAETRIRMWSTYIAGEYGGMNEVMARLFRLTGEKRFLLLQSYMPAQDMHILKNPNSADGSPWYAVPTGEQFETPEWVFKSTALRRWP